MNDPYEVLVDLYIEFNLCQETAEGEGQHVLARYWQGKKDGLRLALAVFAPDAKDAKRWAGLQLTSTQSHYVSEKEDKLLEKLAGWLG